MGEILGHLKPSLVWNHFEEICKYPRPSKKEEKIAEYVMSVGKKNNLEVLRDKAGNVIIRKPASSGKEYLKPVILQCHLDMVAEKNRGVEHNFDKDPIQPYIDSEWVKAKGTTLGADNGIGVATALAVLEDKSLEHGPIECLFTLDEETGLTGATNLEPGVLKGKILINLDSEEFGTFFIGCAGGKNTEAKLEIKYEETPSNFVAYELRVTGLKGGHSGLEIHVGLGNAIKILTRSLKLLSQKMKFKLGKIEGGNKHNAIPRESFAQVLIPKDQQEQFLQFIPELNSMIKEEFKVVDPNLNIAAEKIKTPKKVFSKKSASNLISALYALPHGVIKMSPEIKGLVETSTNLATIRTKGDVVTILTSQRSSVASEIDDIALMVASVFELADAEIKMGDGYPAWKPNVNSEILNLFKETYKEMFNEEPKVEAIHAGLECGVIGEKYPGMDMFSFGPTMFGVHSPDERLKIDSVEPFWNLLTNVLSRIPTENS
ncbi:MAG: aminoacyl-histidine dipeptidase [Ignavibacterium sp.]